MYIFSVQGYEKNAVGHGLIMEAGMARKRKPSFAETIAHPAAQAVARLSPLSMRSGSL